MAKVGNWMRDKQTGEIFQITGVGVFVVFTNHQHSGEILGTQLEERFDLICPQAERRNLEQLLTAMIRMGSAKPGFYNLGITYLSVEKTEEGAITFQWFDNPINLQDLL